jgi:hypothetical protein
MAFTASSPNGWLNANNGATANQAKFIPEVFSKLLQAKFYSSSVLPAISNTDYEGEISGQGDKVTVRTVPSVTINDYVGSVSNQNLITDSVTLNIDKAKYYSFKIDDVLAAQADINMLEEASADAAEQMRIAIETDVLANVGASAHATHDVDDLDKDNILQNILDMSQSLDEKNIPEEGRFIVLNPAQVSLLKQSELRQAYLTGDATSPLRNGKVGTVDRFTVYQSNMLNTVDIDASAATDNRTSVIAGHSKGITFASQFTNTETVRLTDTFGDAVRGLKVYGYEVINPDCLVQGRWK